MTIPLALSYTLMSRLTPTMKVLCAYCVLTMLATVGVSLSRGGILATGAMLVDFCLALLFQPGYWLPAMGVMAGLVALYNLGEYYRLLSLEGNPGYQVQARQALQWYGKSMASNPLDAFVPMRYGMCLDWLGETNEASSYFDLAEKLDPNNARVAFFVGRHSMELGDYPAAQHWFQRSLDLDWEEPAFWSLNMLKDRLADRSGLYKK